eukprot:CAMPEP_0202479124 /NCGR_PEP_ID=MMETSP1360-20130828/94815_1 /ASSEMBLY_ACC=CAM_ASM_000848 /TAXON_ID=515479 /ORGANISM="Licmophora paradoxa, Strain CCMP2313" /LENGTH=280 /DNA_ID=CAMNT_0049106435 /DNA_START=233 /DNA_END=1075 /DNA_ORIENTATION=-
MPSKSFPFTAVIATSLAIGVTAYFYHKKQCNAAKAEAEAPSTKIYEDKATVSKELCIFVAEEAKKAIAERGVFYLGVAGGSLLDALAKLIDHKETVDFSKVVLCFANHKCVDPMGEKGTLFKSNKKFATAVGITKSINPTSTPKAESDGSEEAAFYTEALKSAGVPFDAAGFPVIDLVLLGLGADGHIGSNHPMGPAVATTDKIVVGSPKIGEPSSITLTVESINSARTVGVVVCGGSKGKKEAVKRAMARPFEEPRGTFPAQLLKSPIFFLDKEAAADL